MSPAILHLARQINPELPHFTPTVRTPRLSHYPKMRLEGRCGHCGSRDPVGALCEPCGVKARLSVRRRHGYDARKGMAGMKYSNSRTVVVDGISWLITECSVCHGREKRCGNCHGFNEEMKLA